MQRQPLHSRVSVPVLSLLTEMHWILLCTLARCSGKAHSAGISETLLLHPPVTSCLPCGLFPGTERTPGAGLARTALVLHQGSWHWPSTPQLSEQGSGRAMGALLGNLQGRKGRKIQFVSISQEERDQRAASGSKSCLALVSTHQPKHPAGGNHSSQKPFGH